jgi:hypothetical protein
MELLDAAYVELSGLPGPTPSNRLESLSRRFPNVDCATVRAALDRADELKTAACALANDLEEGRCPDRETALQRLRLAFPNFNDATHLRALRDGWTIDRW